MTTPQHEQRARVLHVAAASYTFEKLLLNQLQHLAEAGYDVRVACAPDGGGFPASLERFSPVPIWIPRSLRPIEVLQGLAQLRDLTWSMRPSILHLHTPAVALPVRLLPRRLFPPDMLIAYTVHGFPHDWSRSLRNRALEALEKFLSPRADLTLFQSKQDLEMATERGFRGLLEYLGNGVDDEWFEIGPAEKRDPLRLIFIGRLVREKGILDLLDALTEVDGVVLQIAGAELASDRDGVREEILARIQKPQLAGRVALLGMLDRQGLMQAVAGSQVVVLPSYREGVPQSLMQGMAAGRPAIATRIRGCVELVEEGETGTLVEAGDTEGLRRAIEEVKALSQDVFALRGIRARHAMLEERRMSQVLDRLGSGYRQLLQDGKGTS